MHRDCRKIPAATPNVLISKLLLIIACNSLLTRNRSQKEALEAGVNKFLSAAAASIVPGPSANPLETMLRDHLARLVSQPSTHVENDDVGASDGDFLDISSDQISDLDDFCKQPSVVLTIHH